MNKIFVALFASLAFGFVLSASIPKHTLRFDHFWTFDEFQEHLTELVEKYPAVSSLRQFGTTSEGRPILAVIVRRGRLPKPTIVVDGAMRPREWISAMAVMFMIHDFVEHNEEYDFIFDHVDFVLVPVANPDGFAYTHEVDRAWNKNRRQVSRTCFGVDTSRNFDFKFEASGRPCVSNYPGSVGLSEEETKAMNNIFSRFSNRILMYINIRGGRQQIAYPYNWINEGAPEAGILKSTAEKASEAIMSAPVSRIYKVGVGADLNGVQTGSAIDYAYETFGITYAYEVSLPGSKDVPWEFPADQLHDTLFEAFRGFVYLAEYVASIIHE